MAGYGFSLLDAYIAAEYLTAISGFRMNEDVVEITDTEDNKCMATVTCQNMSQAKELLSAINATNKDTSLTARLHGMPELELEIQKTWKHHAIVG